jgi:hypothetical protein
MVTASESGVQIELVRVEDIDQRWPLIVDRVAGCLRKAPSDFSAGDVWTQCRSGNWFLFLAWTRQEVIGYSIWQFTKNSYLACAHVGRKQHGRLVAADGRFRLRDSKGSRMPRPGGSWEARPDKGGTQKPAADQDCPRYLRCRLLIHIARMHGHARKPAAARSDGRRLHECRSLDNKEVVLV